MNLRRDPRSVPVMLVRYMVAEGGRVGIDQAKEWLHVKRQTIIQGICRLRRDGLTITTLPGARHPLSRKLRWTGGPYPARWYRLDDLREGRRYLDALFGAGPKS